MACAFDVKRPAESLDEFRLRITNEAAQEEARPTARASSPDDLWEIGARTRNAGSLHADVWTGTGAELADSEYMGVTPSRYALLVSLRTEAVAADIYTPIATQTGVPVAIAT
jgi:hypothetical protein